jgi:CBS domain-containing protein
MLSPVSAFNIEIVTMVESPGVKVFPSPGENAMLEISNVICIDPDQTITNTKAVMVQKRIRHLPVMEKDNLVGIVSIGDVVDAVLEEKSFMIDQLATYIKGIPEPGD